MHLKSSRIIIALAIMSLLFSSCALLLGGPSSGRRGHGRKSPAMQKVNAGATPEQLRSRTAALRKELLRLDVALTTSGKEIAGLDNNLGTTETALTGMSETTGEMHRFAEKVRGFHDRLKNTTGTLSALEVVPTVGNFIAPINNQLKKTEHKVAPVRAKTDKLDGVINRSIKPKMAELAERIREARNELKAVAEAVAKAHAELQEVLTCWPAVLDAPRLNHTIGFIKKSESTLSRANRITHDINTVLAGVNREAGNIRQTLQPMQAAAKELNRFDGILKHADKVNHEVSKVLDKRITINVKIKKFSFTVRQIVSGKVAKIAKKALNAAVGKLLNEVFKRLHIQIPTINGMEQLQQRLHDTQNRLKNAENRMTDAVKVPAQLQDIRSAMETVSANELKTLKVCEEYIPPAPAVATPPRTQPAATPNPAPQPQPAPQDQPAAQETPVTPQAPGEAVPAVN